MSNLPNSFVPIQEEETNGTSSGETPSAISDSVFIRIGGVVNQILNTIQKAAVGTLELSVLTEEQFQAIKGETWVLADGRDAPTDSEYYSQIGPVVADYRAQFVKCYTGGAPPQVIREPQVPSHSHTITWDNLPGEKVQGVSNQLLNDGGTERVEAYPIPESLLTFSTSTGSNTATETRPRNECVNIFVKIYED